jgi:hypothetical protein
MRTAGQLGCIALSACCCALFFAEMRPEPVASTPVETLQPTSKISSKETERASQLIYSREQLQISAPQSNIDNEPRDYAAYKYRYLFADGSMNGVTWQDIAALLAQREAECRPDNTTSACAQTELQLQHRLHPTDYARYALLKDSDTEQHHTTAYAEGIQNLAPLSTAQERALLETRLRMKEVYQITVSNAPPEVRLQAINQYQLQLLGELKSLLSEEQFALLSSYEQTEFEAARQQLLAVSQ